MGGARHRNDRSIRRATTPQALRRPEEEIRTCTSSTNLLAVAADSLPFHGPMPCTFGSYFSLDYQPRLNSPESCTVLSKGDHNHWRPAVAPGRHSCRSPRWSPGVGAQTRILFPSSLGLKPSVPACLSSDSLWPWCRQSVARGLASDALCGGALFPVRGRWPLSHRKPSGRKALAMGDPSSSPKKP